MSSPAASQENPFAPTAFEYAKDRRSSVAKWSTLGVCLLLATPLFLIFAYIIERAWPVFSIDYIWLNPSNKGQSGGIWAPLIGTFSLVIGSLLVVAPIGIMAGIYLNEYAPDNWFTRALGMAVTTLAGVPSIVHALFGLGAFVLGLLPVVNRFFADPNDRDTHWEAGLLTASLTIAVMVLPIIITSTREALGAVPMAFREACWNLGASKWQTIRTVVLPNSLSGILTGIILTVERAAGETAPILFTGATFFKFIADEGFEKLFPYHPGEPFMAMSMHLHVLSTQMSGVPEEVKYGSAAVLIGLILIVNSFSTTLRVILRRRKRW